MKECSIGYSLDGENIFVENVAFEECDMGTVIDYISDKLYNDHAGSTIDDLVGLSILIK